MDVVTVNLLQMLTKHVKYVKFMKKPKCRSIRVRRKGEIFKMTMQLAQKTAFLPFQYMLVTVGRTVHHDFFVG